MLPPEVMTTRRRPAESVACVIGEYRRLRFPAPEGGTITVIYPIMFSPGE
jgi:hypothetical protein